MEQGTPEWHEARRGILTASRFGDVLAAPHTARYLNYIDDVFGELIGVPDFLEGDNPPWFRHGKDWEAEAIASYEFNEGVEVAAHGLIKHPELEFVGCSPDGLVGNDGGVEVKCRKSLDAFEKSVAAGVESVHVPQIQGCMWVTGRQWWDYISYYKNPETADDRMHVFRVHRDEAYITRLEIACRTVWVEIQRKVETYHGRY